MAIVLCWAKFPFFYNFWFFLELMVVFFVSFDWFKCQSLTSLLLWQSYTTRPPHTCARALTHRSSRGQCTLQSISSSLFLESSPSCSRLGASLPGQLSSCLGTPRHLLVVLTGLSLGVMSCTFLPYLFSKSTSSRTFLRNGAWEVECLSSCISENTLNATLPLPQDVAGFRQWRHVSSEVLWCPFVVF